MDQIEVVCGHVENMMSEAATREQIVQAAITLYCTEHAAKTVDERLKRFEDDIQTLQSTLSDIEFALRHDD